MSDFLKKCLERGLTPSNVASYLSLKFLPILGSLWGTLRFRVKALLLGIKAGSGIRAHGPVGLMPHQCWGLRELYFLLAALDCGSHFPSRASEDFLSDVINQYRRGQPAHGSVDHLPFHVHHSREKCSGGA